jgi:hypothetical protein
MTRRLDFCPAVFDGRWQLHDKLKFGLPIALFFHP